MPRIGRPRRRAKLLLVVAALLLSPNAGAQELPVHDLYEDGIPFEEFLANADRRREEWHAHYEGGAPTHQALQEAKAVGGEVKFLVVAEDWCGDSVNTVPYLARLVEQVPGWEMRVINSRRGADVMAANPTPDGRTATPHDPGTRFRTPAGGGVRRAPDDTAGVVPALRVRGAT